MLFKSQKQIIEQIHNEFDSAQERLLLEANRILSVKSNLPQIADRLKAVGFTSTPTAKKGLGVKKQLVQSKEQAELINYYSNAYPFLKFLTESELDRICNKYNLVYASVDRYIEEVPEKNLKDIELAQRLKEVDKAEDMIRFFCSCVDFGLDRGERNELKTGILVKASTFMQGCNDETLPGYFNKKVSCKYQTLDWEAHRINKTPLFIAAPLSHFNTASLIRKGLGFFDVTKIEVKDPIVFRYVRGGVQVITKWGLEANDPSLVVPALN
jgi:hypothetical protein